MFPKTRRFRPESFPVLDDESFQAVFTQQKTDYIYAEKNTLNLKDTATKIFPDEKIFQYWNKRDR